MPPKSKSKANGPEPAKNNLSVSGCLFMPQMRTVCSLLDMNQVKYTCEDVNIFENDDSLSALSTAGQPVLTRGKQVIMGDAPSLLRYICLSKDIKPFSGVDSLQPVKDHFYPMTDPVQRQVIDSFLDYVEHMVHRTSSRLTKLVIQRLIFDERGQTENYQDMDNELEMSLYT